MTECALQPVRSFALEAVADCPFSVAQDYATDFLRDRLRTAIGMRVGRCRLMPGRAWISARPDFTDRGKPHDELVLRWFPTIPLLPSVEIVIRFRIAWLTTRLAIDMYLTRGDAPLRRFGAWLFIVMMRLVVGRLLTQLARYLKERESAYRIAHPPALGLVRMPNADCRREVGLDEGRSFARTADPLETTGLDYGFEDRARSAITPSATNAQRCRLPTMQARETRRDGENPIKKRIRGDSEDEHGKRNVRQKYEDHPERDADYSTKCERLPTR